MYRILIVDDEPYIASSLMASLAESLDAENYELGVAFSAEEAIRKMRARRIDIIISDIQMPGMDGLEFRQATLRRWPDSQFIFLTGHANFQYARDALRADCVDYILKTEGDEIIIGAVLEAGRRLDTERLDRAEKVAERCWIEDSRKEIARERIRGYLQGLPTDVESTHPMIAELAAGVTPDALFWLSIVRIEGDSKSISGEHKRSYDSIADLARDAFAENNLCVSIWLEGDLSALILQGSKKEHLDLALVKGILESVQDVFSREVGTTCSIAIDGEPCLWTRLPDQVKKLCDALGSAPSGGSLLVVSRKERVGTHHQLRPETLEERVLKFVERNIGTDVSLTRLAEHLGLNPSYLSRQFHQITGINLSAVISRLRYEKAARLIRDGSESISDISSAVGFWTPSYFTRFFKKMSGMTPADYREKHGHTS